MKKLYIAFVGMACLCLACSRDDRALLMERERFRIRKLTMKCESFNGQVLLKARLRGGENCRVRIYKGEKLIYSMPGGDTTFNPVSSGTVPRAPVTSVTSVDASFDKYYEGNKSFEICQAQTTPGEGGVQRDEYLG